MLICCSVILTHAESILLTISPGASKTSPYKASCSVRIEVAELGLHDLSPPSLQSHHKKLHKLHCSPYVGMTGTGQKWYISAINVPICTCDQLIRLGTRLSWTVAWELLPCHRQLSWLSNQGSNRWKHWFAYLFIYLCVLIPLNMS